MALKRRALKIQIFKDQIQITPLLKSYNILTGIFTYEPLSLHMSATYLIICDQPGLRTKTINYKLSLKSWLTPLSLYLLSLHHPPTLCLSNPAQRKIYCLHWLQIDWSYLFYFVVILHHPPILAVGGRWHSPRLGPNWSSPSHFWPALSSGLDLIAHLFSSGSFSHLALFL